MRERDAQRAKEFGVQKVGFSDAEETRRNTALEKIKAISVAQFRYWTEDEFAAPFRKIGSLNSSGHCPASNDSNADFTRFLHVHSCFLPS
ncbi:MAG: hypothetical protein LBU32_06010 [Clostridiales bacterium]|jgi:hypothetical protein|nr:hypothetical protein [Clostridiales bacterium]